VKTLIEIDRKVWGRVKNFATVRDASLNTAVGYLLSFALDSSGYPDEKRGTGDTRR
jgi:hypothetical protein